MKDPVNIRTRTRSSFSQREVCIRIYFNIQPSKYIVNMMKLFVFQPSSQTVVIIISWELQYHYITSTLTFDRLTSVLLQSLRNGMLDTPWHLFGQSVESLDWNCSRVTVLCSVNSDNCVGLRMMDSLHWTEFIVKEKFILNQKSSFYLHSRAK